MKHGVGKLKSERMPFKTSDYPKMKTALESIEELIETSKPNSPNLSAEDRKFLEAYTVHWVHADKRAILADYISRKLRKAING